METADPPPMWYLFLCMKNLQQLQQQPLLLLLQLLPPPQQQQQQQWQLQPRIFTQQQQSQSLGFVSLPYVGVQHLNLVDQLVQQDQLVHLDLPARRLLNQSQNRMIPD